MSSLRHPHNLPDDTVASLLHCNCYAVTLLPPETEGTALIGLCPAKPKSAGRHLHAPLPATARTPRGPYDPATQPCRNLS